MSGRLALLLLIIPVLLSFHGDNPKSPAEDIGKLYREADRLYHASNSTDSTYNLSLNYFGQVIHRLEEMLPDHSHDSLLFHAYLKQGVLLDLVKTRYAEASQSYCKAIRIQQNVPKQISDSLLFEACNYAGACYYNLNNFDSANYFLLRAQQLIEKYPHLPEKERLYNTLGVLYYDNGNYLQSRNYFNQALEILNRNQPVDQNYASSIEINMATAMYRLGKYKEAIAIYQKILSLKSFRNYAYLNMGRANSAMTNYPEALVCFRKVNPAEVPGVWNEMAAAALKLKQPDSALYFLNAFSKIPGNKVNVVDGGINQLYRADLLVSGDRVPEALASLQKAIGIFSGHFSDTAIASNPEHFTGTYTYAWLFEALFRKAEALETLYRSSKEEKYALYAFDAYKRVIALLSYIEKSYDTDDAKLLLKKKSWQVYQQAMDLSFTLNQRHPEGKYLEEAFRICEKNKASIVAENLQQQNLGNTSGEEAGLLQQERNIKYNIARLNVRSDQSKDLVTLESNASEKSRYEIALADLQKKIESNDHDYKNKNDDHFPAISELQQHLHHDQAMVSFSFGTNALHAFIVTPTAFHYVRIDSLATLKHNIETWLGMLKQNESGRKFSGQAVGRAIYEQLIKPIRETIEDKGDWIIIPDGLLYYLPFESLPVDDNRYLLESVAISYELSSRLIVTQPDARTIDEGPNNILAFAPFVHTEPLPYQGFSSSLPASGDEISGLRVNKFVDGAATKSMFLQSISQYPIIHLATHAMADMHKVSSSYIAFYPQKNSRTEDCLFLEELYGMDMKGVQLMIVSACETGKGELVNNEGVMSIARAFTYAGCSSVINSLWKADDKATSAILKQFHVYLQHGFSKSRALQMAKLDYIKGNSLFRTPNYWSTLVLVGNAEPLYVSHRTRRWAILLAGLAGIGVVSLAKIKRSKKKE